MVTDSPFAYGVKKVHYLSDVTPNKVFRIVDTSDEIGFTPIMIKVKCKEAGNLSIVNQTTNSTIIVKNCSVGEELTIDGDSEIITTNLTTHNLSNDFNFKFPTLQNDYDRRLNNISFSLNADVEISYTPVIKNSI